MASDPARKTIRYFVPVLVLAMLAGFIQTSVFAAGNAASSAEFNAERAKKPRYAVIGYITAYLYNDFNAVGYFDAAITTAIEEQLNVTTENWKMKKSDAEKRQMDVVRRNELEKLTNIGYAPFEPQGSSTISLSPLYKVLYPGMKYRIIAVRDVKPATRGATTWHCAKEVTLELMYPDASRAPYHKGKRIKKGVVRVRLRKWNWPLEYKVCGYVPVREGMEYFM